MRVEYKYEGTTVELELVRSTYVTNGTLAVIAYAMAATCEDDSDDLEWFEEGEEFAVLTKNLHGGLDPNQQYIDENNVRGITEALVRAGAVQLLDHAERSGFCSYVLAEWDVDGIPELG